MAQNNDGGGFVMKEISKYTLGWFILLIRFDKF